MREGLPLVPVFAGLAIVQVVIRWYSHDLAPTTLAHGLRFPLFWLGWSFVFASSVSTGTIRRRSLTILGLAPATDGPGSEAPGTVIVAQPILVGLGTACLGFALGLNVIVAFAHDTVRSESRTETVGWCVILALMIAVAAGLSTRSARRLYVWSQEVAASAATAEADADRARIRALQAQMNPHFLFNALNTVASLLGTDGARARRTVQNLSGMLEHTLQRSARPLTTVEEELQFVRDYLDIERERFGPRLQVTYDIDPDTARMAVPTMSLQPLVENAIKHAVTSRLEGGYIRITARRSSEPSELRLGVEDDGPGFVPGSEEGTGLGNLRARLRSLYGPAAKLTTETLATGARVSFTVPNPPSPSASARQAPPSASARQAPTNLSNLPNLKNPSNPPSPSASARQAPMHPS